MSYPLQETYKLQINYSLFKIKNNILTNSYEQDQQLLAFYYSVVDVSIVSSNSDNISFLIIIKTRDRTI